MPVTPDDLGMALLRETRDLAKSIDNVLRGVDGKDGLIAKVNELWRHHRDTEDDRRRLKILPADPEVVKIRWRAIGEIAVAAGVITSLLLQLLGG